MKKIVYILAAALALTACFQEEIHHPSEAQAPETASIYEPIITVDQEINQVTFSIDAKDVIPVWLFYNAKTDDFTDRYAENGLKKIFASAGDYKVRMQVMNAAGVSPDYVEKTFHINNTIMSFDKYVTFLAGGTGDGMSKVWHIDGEVAAHMGCGESGTDGTNWWSAAVGDKAAFGVYEDLLTFGSNYSYVYNPGEDGATYVNIDGVTVSPFVDQKAGATADYNVTVAEQTATYKFEVEGDDVFLVLPEHTLFPYIPNDAFWAEPKMKILSINRETLELVHDNGAIAWHFILTSKAGKVVFKGFNYNADSNLWKPADAEGGLEISYYYAPGWAQIADPTLTKDGNEYSWNLPSATSDRWQAQVFMVPTTPIATTADKHYDFSCILNTTKDLTAKVKLHKVGDDGVILVDSDVPVKAGEEVVFYLTDIEGIDAENVRLVLDFGGCQDGTDVSVGRIVLKDHAIDDGTVLPDDNQPEEPETGAHYDITGATNFWRSMTYTMSFYTSHGNDWAGLPDSGFEADDQNYVYVVTMPEETNNQWQRQVAFHTSMSSSADKKYDFCCTLIPTMDINGVTIKLVKEGDDNTFYFADRHDIKANEPFVYKMPNMDGIDMEAIALFFDFGGNPAGAEVEIRDICFQEHQDPQGGGESGGATFDYNSDRNLWKAADAAHTFSQYYATTNNWTQLPNPDITENNGTYSFTLDTETVAQWQAQFFIIPDAPIALSSEKTYDFQCKVTLSQAVNGVTFKLTDTASDSNFLFTEQRDIAAYEEFVFTLTGLTGIDAEAVKMVFDFGGNPANTEVEIKEIILQEHIGEVSGGGGNDSSDFDYNAADNMWKAADAAHTFSQYYATTNNWTQLPNPEITENNGTYSFTLDTETVAQWQAQFFIIPDVPIALSAAKTYDFQCKVELSQAVNGVTFKLTDTTSDGNFLFTEQRNIAAYEEFVFTLTDKQGIDADAVKMVFDFGGNPANTEVTIKEIILREHK